MRTKAAFTLALDSLVRIMFWAVVLGFVLVCFRPEEPIAARWFMVAALIMFLAEIGILVTRTEADT